MDATPRLDDLIADIESRHGDPLHRLAAAVVMGQNLDVLADHLIGHFVDQARRSGASWTMIGQSIGVTKQAAQKRFVPNEPVTAESDPRIFGRYTDHARTVIVHAQDQARQLAADAIRPGHLLLAVVQNDDLRPLLGEVDTDALRDAVSAVLGIGTYPPDSPLQFSPASKKAIELGHREALRRNAEHIEPRHVLLGVLAMTDEPEIAAAIAAGVDPRRIEGEMP
jgi:hypothetical protein